MSERTRAKTTGCCSRNTLPIHATRWASPVQTTPGRNAQVLPSRRGGVINSHNVRQSLSRFPLDHEKVVYLIVKERICLKTLIRPTQNRPFCNGRVSL